jgi:5-methylcytosine-specific restriction endonuclease McrA
MSQSVLDTNVLVLNRFYMAIRVINVRRAFTLLYRDCAEVIDNDTNQYISYDFECWCELSQLTSVDKQPGEDYIQAVSFELRVPRIVRLTRFEKMPMQAVRFNRKNLFARDDHACQYCGRNEPAHKLSLDHVIPRSLGGPTTWENLVCCCLRCNSRKGGRTPKQARMTLMSRPTKPRVNPMLIQSMEDPRYECWKTFLPAAG